MSLIPDGEETVLELEHSPVPVDVVRTVGETSGLGAGWELGLVSLHDFLAGRLPDDRAIDRMAGADPDELAAIGEPAGRISDAWGGVIERR